MTALDQDGREYPVHCCACLQHGRRVVAAWVTAEGYLVCEEHVGMSVEDLVRAVWKPGTAT